MYSIQFSLRLVARRYILVVFRLAFRMTGAYSSLLCEWTISIEVGFFLFLRVRLFTAMTLNRTARTRKINIKKTSKQHVLILRCYCDSTDVVLQHSRGNCAVIVLYWTLLLRDKIGLFTCNMTRNLIALLSFSSSETCRAKGQKTRRWP